MSEKERKKLSTKLNVLFEEIYNLQSDSQFVYLWFQTLPKRTGTDYYKIIQRPLSLHAVGRKIKQSAYEDPQEFVNDLGLITWNARYYNLPGSDVYKAAQVLDQYIRDVVIPKLGNDKAVPNGSQLVYPYFGDLPDENGQDSPLRKPVYAISQSQPGFEQETSPILNTDELEMSVTPQAEPASLSRPLVKTTFNREPVVSTPNRNKYTRQHNSQVQAESGIRRGRPPIIDKPFETRIKSILKAFKKLRDSRDRLLIKHFDKLPDSKSYPDYYQIVKDPISLNEIRIKVRSRKYSNVDQFINDLDLMFANCQQYFQRDPYSEEFMDYQQFRKEANVIVQNELSKSDKEVLMSTSTASDGVLRYPLETLEIGGYSYKVGAWVLMKNPADPERPIIGQIFRLWSTEDGKRYCNMCWYYRPEQTCHGVDRLFFQNEVCKTGQYRDHLVDDIVGPCYVLFLTRYQKGDLPEGVIPSTSPWFICEFRYNENTHVFNRIRTWKACLPDEVRDDPEQPLIPLHENRKLIKYESPIKSTLEPGARLNDPIPDPIPGTSSSPPIRGSVYITAPILNDDLGQYTTSPNTVPIPDHDDLKTGRKAYLFTPISQLKGGGGSSGAVYATSPALPHGSPNHEPSRHTMGSISNLPLGKSAMSPPLGDVTPLGSDSSSRYQPQQQDDKPQLPTSYKSLHDSLQENKKIHEQQLHQFQQQQNQQIFKRALTPTPSSIIPTGTNYYNSTPAFSNLYAGGILSYGIDAEELDDLSDLVNKRQKMNPEEKGEEEEEEEEVIFYRAPPVQLVGNRIITNSKTELGHSAKYLAWKIKTDAGLK
ncbi:hypothetical protein KGF57_000496 [Candida theae]|uniref:Uncharacterized protein n=1 Tax=Candida theae TaxID=1198502 RepID=A0AAD5BIR0_9ASCO|nr:uncharacterized protein KGF57_000496 [Candida theae]KAI5967068.1 hypothetical protein KGF57_000496 [Candida theae]